MHVAGKSSLVQRFVSNRFDSVGIAATVGVDMEAAGFDLGGKVVGLELFDTV